MAKKGKMKISKVKRNNHTTNKMKKSGSLRLQRHRTKIQKHKQQTQPQQVEYSDSDSASGEEWADMLDEEEQKYILSRLAKQPQLLSNVPEENAKEERKAPKRKRSRVLNQMMEGDSGADSDSDLEGKYEQEQAEKPVKKLRQLLPIKTKDGVLEQVEECEESESEPEADSAPPSKKIKVVDHSDQESSDSGVEATPDEEPEDEGTVSAVQLLAARRDRLAHEKLRIGALCSSLLECPEKKLKNLYPILYLMEERLRDGALNLVSVRKLAALSAAEVFRDILPDYTLRHQDYSNVKLKKDTLSLYKYEKELLGFYKRYLQKLEKACGVLRRKKGDNRRPDEATVGLALVSLQCMASLLVARPDFNYSANIAQSVVPHLASRDGRAREVVTAACVAVFANDKRGDITLTIVRLINQLVKRSGERLPPGALDCLLSLRIRDVDMDLQADVTHKKRQEEKHKKRIINLSKKEKKRAKKLKEVEKELLETEAQESEMARRKQLTEVTRTVFHIYFRLLKAAPHSRLLAAALAGLAKFTHVINLEYYSDLVAILSRLLRDDAVGAREKLLCVRTVLSILGGAGDALNVDPAAFHAHLYAHMLDIRLGGTNDDVPIVLEAVAQVCGRARRVSPAVLQAFAKRLAGLALQLHHNGALACLALLHALRQESKAVAILFDVDDREGFGSGAFHPLASSPEHAGAHASRLHELATLRTHYHPAVRECAAALLAGAPPRALRALSPLEIYRQYDCSKLEFKPAIPPPKPMSAPSKRKQRFNWAQTDFKEMCESIEENVPLIIR